MYTPKGIAFSPTYDCPSKCDHCNIPFDRFDVKTQLQIDAACRVLEEAKSIGLHSFQFAGGEPTLCEDFMIEVIGAGKKLSMKAHRPPTNCALGGEQERMKRFFSRLSEIGFSSGFRISYDSFHKAVPPEWTARFIAAADEYFNLNRFVIGCCDIDEIHSRRRLETLVNLLGEYGLPSELADEYIETPRGHIKLGFWAPTRPTWKPLPDSTFRFREVAPDSRDNKRYSRDAPITPFGCLGPRGVGYFWIDPSGDVRACCGNSAIFSDPLIIGNVYREHLAEIYGRALASPLISILAHGGPVALALSAGADAALSKKYTHRCELCASLLADPSIADKL